MRTPLAWHNLVHNKMRTAVAEAGVTFAVVLVFMQLGFLGSIETTVTRFFDALDFDLLIRSPAYLHLSNPRTFPMARVQQAAELPEVQSATPVQIGLSRWRSPVGEHRRRAIIAIGVQPEQRVFTLPEIQEKFHLLTDPQFVLIDRKSRSEFGPRNGKQFSDEDIGVVTEVEGHEVQIVGHFALGTGLTADGAILMNVMGFQRLQSPRNPNEASFGLVRLKPGVDAAAAADRLRLHLCGGSREDENTSGVDVLTRPEAIRYELNRWIRETPVGMIFVLGAIVSLMVGTVVVYQVLSSDVASHMRHYATLKAMGYTNGFLGRVVLAQAVGLALVGFLPGLVLSEGLYWFISGLANLPVVMNVGRVFLVLAMTVAMCALSGLGALRKVWLADPASLF